MKPATSLSSLTDTLRNNHRRDPYVNIPLLVSRYHLEGDAREHYVEGINLSDDKEQTIRIKLRPDDRTIDLVQNPEKRRYELADFANKAETASYVADSSDPDAKPGVLLFTNCASTGKNEFSASWVSSGIHNASNKHERLERAYCSVDVFPPSVDGTRHATAQVRMLLTSESTGFAANDREGILAKIKENIGQQPGKGGYIPEVLIRLIDCTALDETNGRPLTISTTLRAPTKSLGEDDINVYCTADETMAIVLNPDSPYASHKDLQSILDFCSQPGMSDIPIENFAVEVIPVIRRNFGPETAKSFFELKEFTRNDKTVTDYALSNEGHLLRDRFNMKTVELINDAEEIVSHRMFTPAVFITNDHKDSSVDYSFVTKIQTLEAWPKGFKESEVPTPFFNSYINDPKDYLCKIRTEDAALSPEQLARKAERQARNASAKEVKANNTTTQQNVAEPAAKTVTAQSAPKAVEPAKNTPTAVVSEPMSKPTVDKVATSPEPEPEKHAPQVQHDVSHDDDDFDDSFNAEHMEDLEELFGASRGMQG